MKRIRLSKLARTEWFSPQQWTRRLAFWGGGFAVGLAAVLMAVGAEWAQDLFDRLLAISPFVPLLITPLGFAAAAAATRFFFPNAQGSGIPQAIVARDLTDETLRGKLLSPRIAIGKILMMWIGIASGGSIGREGPTVQVGASIMHAVGRLWGRQQSALILAGSAAGVAAAFNTPLGGIVFAIEEMSRSLERGVNGLILSAVIIAGVASLAFMGDYTYFGQARIKLEGMEQWIVIPFCGIACGLAGGIFSLIVVAVLTGRLPLISTSMQKYPIRFAAACGLAVALVGILSGSATFGTSYDTARALVEGTDNTSAGFGLLKLLATAISATSGIPGGFFSPSLAVGAGLGADLAALFQDIPLSAIVLMSMVAYFSGVVQAPITSFVIVAEMTDSYGMTVPLMMASIIGSGTAKLIGARPVYLALAEPVRASMTSASEAAATPGKDEDKPSPEEVPAARVAAARPVEQPAAFDDLHEDEEDEAERPAAPTHKPPSDNEGE